LATIAELDLVIKERIRAANPSVGLTKQVVDQALAMVVERAVVEMSKPNPDDPPPPWT
jgi:hypothetical protein